MAKEARKLQRALERDGSDGKSRRNALKAPVTVPVAEAPDPFSPQNLKSLALRIGIPVAGIWLLGALIFGVSQSTTVQWIALGLPGVLTLALLGVLFWVVRQAKKVKGMTGLLGSVETAEDRRAAIEHLDANYKAGDATATFAKAQLLMQEDPKKALEVLEQIDLKKVMANVADEARAQRAMIHLTLGDVGPARDLVDGIDLSRHQDAKTRAMMGAVVSEAWARSGQAKRAQTTLEIFNPDDETLAQIRPQLYRARAYVYAAVGDLKLMRQALKRLGAQDIRLLAAFMLKKTHPLLQKEAKKLIEQSGQVPRKMLVQRR